MKKELSRQEAAFFEKSVEYLSIAIPKLEQEIKQQWISSKVPRDIEICKQISRVCFQL